ncbi:MAG: hypothetical protein FWH56_00520 [Betaproteobacteria bacterium]|nr:hypothetical protein [Betaproteobacteria bacterium]
MRISLPRKYLARLFAGIMATIFSLGYGFSMATPAAQTILQTEEDSGAETPTPTPAPPQPPKPRPPH